ncbi:hypothetical protein [Pyxidicoccus sp. MSG2]|uniref:hypothetical protein n=1 Tax=Pyxidicoccus sp. MSG2 TaxID=2996790 RepID=UPI0022710DA2|nr:hypothetical protein [Pyxidicoccus sp. MSG2]MCY1016669.1 hypothetical protein [Pyxidicoccus sp. MSG2]
MRGAFLLVLLTMSACSRCMPVAAVPQYGPPVPEEGIQAWYDATGGETRHSVTLGVMPVPWGPEVIDRWLEVGFSQPGRGARTRPARVWLTVEDRSESDWSERTSVALVLDGRRVPLKGVGYEARGTKVGSIQTLTVEVDVSVVDRMARAHAAAVEVSGVSHPLESSQRDLLREFVSTP